MEHIFKYDSETAVAETDKGKVRGYVYDNISIFKGIPYAKARRFHAPEPVERWKGILDATNYGYVCPIPDVSKPSGELCVPHRYWPMNEECQNLNVWTPACDGKKRPVMVWLHGGGFETGSAIEQLAYEGENMCRLGQVVVVSVNHRLNILGYCDLSAFGEEYINSGNAGTDDLVAALMWIHNNISGFGGDAGNVTIFGQSGGGAKVTALLQTPAADGLYAKAINMSGVLGEPYADILADSKGNGEDLGRMLMKELKIQDVRGLETVSYSRLLSAYRKVKPELQKNGKYVGGTPHPNVFYKGTPEENGFRGETAHIPMLIGSVYGEFDSFVSTPYNKHKMTQEEGRAEVRRAWGEAVAGELLPLYMKAYPERNPVDLLTLDFMFRLPVQRYIRLRSTVNPCTYAYMFNLDLPVDGGRTPWHCADIPYVFHNTSLIPVAQEIGVTETVEQQIFGCVMAFAATGNPNHEEIPDWPASIPGKEYTMVFGKQTNVRVNYDTELIAALAGHRMSALTKSVEQMMDSVQH